MVLLQSWIYFRFVETKLSEVQLEPHFLQEFVGRTHTSNVLRYWKLNTIGISSLYSYVKDILHIPVAPPRGGAEVALG